MWRRSPRTDRKRSTQQPPFRAAHISESLAIGLGCDRTPPGTKRRAVTTVGLEGEATGRREQRRA